jgi:hypothetical protein
VATLLVASYFGAGALILRYRLDARLWPPDAANEIGPLPPPTFATDGAGGSGTLVRAVGPDVQRCVVFFPGHSGGFTRYMGDLFPALNAAGLRVWAVAYAGQDGAPGRASRATLPGDIERLLRRVEAHCPRAHTVFLGRSLGATVAAVAAANWRPSGLVLEGAGASLAAAVRQELAQHWYTRLLEVLPIETLVVPDFPLPEWLRRFDPKRTVVFQGALDERMPVADLAPLVQMGVTVHVVPGAQHGNTYQLAGRAFYDAVAGLSPASN